MVCYDRHIAGKQAEKLARDYLQKHDCEILYDNYRCYQGEIDLIARDGKHIAFVEVRFRKYNAFGTALESINHKKQQKIIRAANHFLQMKNWLYKVIGRFDIIVIQPINSKMQLDWFKNAFAADNE